MFANEDIKVINGIHGYTSTVDNKIKVFLLYEDVLNRLGLIKYDKIPDQKVVTDINGVDQYGYQPAVDPSKAGIIYMAISNLVNQDFTITNYLPSNPLSPDGYIPSELAIELARQCGNQQFEMELIQQIVPRLQPQQNHIKHNTPNSSLHNPFEGNVTDLDNAYRFYNQYDNRIRYVQDMDRFIIYHSTWDNEYGKSLGGVWKFANIGQFEPLLTEFKTKLESLAQNDEEKRIANIFGKLQYTNRAISKIKGIKECIISSSDLNRYPYLLNTLNGIIDLRTTEFMPADPNLYLTQQTQIIYEPKTSPIFEQFITDILPDPDTREAVLTYLGYCLTGDTSAQKALFIIGSGANGKSTLLNIMTRLLGMDYSTSVPIKLFNEHSVHYKSGVTPERIALIGKRFAQVDEIKAGEVLDAGEFKLLTGSDAIPARNLFKEMTVFSPTHKFIFSGNFLPELKNNNDGGLNRRLMVAEFPRKFGPDEIKPHLLDMLTDPESLTGILNLLVHKAFQYYKYGLFDSSNMMDLKSDYISGLTKIIQSILQQNYIYDEDSYVLHSELEKEVNKILYPNNKLNQYQLGKSMRKLGYEPTRIKSKKDRDKIAYLGLRHK